MCSDSLPWQDGKKETEALNKGLREEEVMDITSQKYAVLFHVTFGAVTGLLIRSGRAGEFTDSELETTGDNSLHINGYVWSSLLCRALSRCEKHQERAKTWGRFDAEEAGVSALWTEATFIPRTDYIPVVNPGIRVDREWGTAASGALYSDELGLPLDHITMTARILCESKEEAEKAEKAFLDALYVIDQGVETIGGGWSYGFGRLKVEKVESSTLNLSEKEDRKALWYNDFHDGSITWQTKTLPKDKDVSISRDRGWYRVEVEAAIPDGQMLAIHDKVPGIGIKWPTELPDTFVFTRPVKENKEFKAIPTITGKAFRQAVLSREIERKLRSLPDPEPVCINSSDPKRSASVPDPTKNRKCVCKRCIWFGDSDGGGIISVGDAFVDGVETEIIHRIQLCEHSMQNIQLFNGQYLTGGNFTLNIIIDRARKDTCPDELFAEVSAILDDMKPDGNAPPGWYRLGATTTCTGQLKVNSYKSIRIPANQEAKND